MDDIKRWSTQELSDYIRLFDTAEARENVVKELMASKILNDFLNTTHGRLILNSTIDGVRSNMMKIVRLSIENAAKNTGEITQSALQINVAYDFMHGIATTLTRGEDHETKMRKE
uniref:Uncharacterized protein n=1 Tax=viral metagenome TaxID=1070528 RepID=A0A6M3KXH2_9ZZZZ